MDDILRMLKASPAAPGGERVLVPGEIEFAHESRARKHGIALAEAIVGQLATLGGGLGVPLPSPLADSSQSASAAS
jgi:LDH2 family malate/lactate/ureidoglycolate dehydrogenase